MFLTVVRVTRIDATANILGGLIDHNLRIGIVEGSFYLSKANVRIQLRSES
jgi:hypothetical protein